MEPVVVKISGSLTDDPQAVDQIAGYINTCGDAGRPVVVVHGGGRQINTLSAELGVTVNQVQGRRITDPEAMRVLLYTVGGSVNRTLVSDFRRKGIKAVGLTGADAGLTTAHRRAPLRINQEDVDFQLVGEIDEVDPTLPMLLCQNGMTPVIGCLTWAEDHGMLNINADTFAIMLAVAIKSRELVMLMEPEAVRDANGTGISHMTPVLRDEGVSAGWISDGMVPKLHTGFQAIERGVQSVRLTNPHGLLNQSGTLLTQN